MCSRSFWALLVVLDVKIPRSSIDLGYLLIGHHNLGEASVHQGGTGGQYIPPLVLNGPRRGVVTDSHYIGPLLDVE